MLESIKMALRIKSSVFDNEISELIDAAKLDLKISGIANINDEDPLIIQAVKIYCKVNFGDNKDSEKYKSSYDMLKQHLSLCGDYNV